MILRKERPHPGAQLTFTDVDGHRITAFITDTPPRVVPGQLAGLDLRHRQHARVEDRIRQAKATGMRNFPCHHYAANNAWLEIVMTAMDLVAWSKLIGFADEPDLAVGRADHPRLAPDPCRVHLTPDTLRSRDPKNQPPQVEPAPTRHDSRARSQPPMATPLHRKRSRHHQAFIREGAKNRG